MKKIILPLLLLLGVRVNADTSCAGVTPVTVNLAYSIINNAPAGSEWMNGVQVHMWAITSGAPIDESADASLNTGNTYMPGGTGSGSRNCAGWGNTIDGDCVTLIGMSVDWYTDGWSTKHSTAIQWASAANGQIYTGPFVFYIPNAVETCTTNLTWQFKNNSLYGSQCYAIFDNSGGTMKAVGNLTTLPAGTVGSIHLKVNCDKAGNYSVCPVNCPSDGSTSAVGSTPSGAPIPPSSSDSSQGGTPSDTVGLPDAGTNGFSYYTNAEGNIFATPKTPTTGIPQNNIMWSPASSGSTSPDGQAVASTVKDAASVMFDAVNKNALQAHSDAQAIRDAIANQQPSTGSNTYNFGLTNYAQESTLAGLSNLFATAGSRLPTNSPSDETSAAGGQVASGSNYLAGILGDGFGPNADKGGGIGTPLDSWTINVPYGKGYDIDLNPFHLGWVSGLAAFVRKLIEWLCAVGLVYRNMDALSRAVESLGATRQASASGQTVLGTNANAITALVMAGAITLAMLAVPVFATGWFSTSGIIGTVVASPFTGQAANNVAAALWMVDQFFPLAFMVWCVMVGIGFRASQSACVWGVQTVTRFLVG